MLSLKLSPQSLFDLEDIYKYTIEKWGLKQAEKYQDELYECMKRVSRNPNLGSIYYFRKGNYRKININRHLIFYTITAKDCVVMRILHEKMDLENIL